MKKFPWPVEQSPEVLGGTPVLPRTRVPVATLLGYLEAGDSLDGFLQDFPTVSREAAVAVLAAMRHDPSDAGLE